MSKYIPDRWCILRIDRDTYKVFACWQGGYLDSDSWKMNSGIVKVTMVEGHYEFEGHSGNIYSCQQDLYGLTGYGADVLNSFILATAPHTVEILPATTNWLEMINDT